MYCIIKDYFTRSICCIWSDNWHLSEN